MFRSSASQTVLGLRPLLLCFRVWSTTPNQQYAFFASKSLIRKFSY